jgi:hypothetical protein
MPQVPEGFTVENFATGLVQPRVIQIAPDGDIFVAESEGGRISVFAADAAGDLPAEPEVFAEGLNQPFGMLFYPPGSPEFLYVGETNQVVRFPYAEGQTARRAESPRSSSRTNATGPAPSRQRRVASASWSRSARHPTLPAPCRTSRPKTSRPSSKATGWAPPGAARRTARSCGSSIPTAATSATMRPACATAQAWPFTPAPTRSGARGTSATTSARTSPPTT